MCCPALPTCPTMRCSPRRRWQTGCWTYCRRNCSAARTPRFLTLPANLAYSCGRPPSGCWWGLKMRSPICRSGWTTSSTSSSTALPSRSLPACFPAAASIAQNIPTANILFPTLKIPVATSNTNEYPTDGQTVSAPFVEHLRVNISAPMTLKRTPMSSFIRFDRRIFLR